MHNQLEKIIIRATGATAVARGEMIQSLWSGYGEIVRYALTGTNTPSVVLKHVKFPSKLNHPRGWNNNLSHQRKVKSYEVEMAWYKNWANKCGDKCRVPSCFASETRGEEHVMVLEDLDVSGFPVRKSNMSLSDIKLCLSWLAHFHALFMGLKPEGLWQTGTYWHLATRPDELEAMDDEALRDAAPVLDSMLNNANYQSLVHGDAKVANFCFSSDGQSVAAVDFQYVGAGCGMKDVAYLLGSCLSDVEHEQLEAMLLDYYFEVLAETLNASHPNIDILEVEKEWRTLFPVAQTDFYRFLIGWMPTHWKINDYNKRVALDIVQHL